MATVALGWAGLAASFAGLGALALRVIAPDRRPALHASFWLGWALWIAALQLAHFFVALDRFAVSLPLLIAGAIGLRMYARAWWASVTHAVRAHPVAWIAFGVAAVWLCNRSLGPLLTVDAGLYHLQSIRWAADHPLVGGLANLHGRLAFNSSAFLWMASLDALVESSRGFQLASTLLLTVTGAERVARATRATDRRRRVFEALLLLPLGYAAAVMHLSATGPDWIVLFLGITAASLLWDGIDEARTDSANQGLVVLAGIAAVGVTIKLSFAVLALGIAIARIAFSVRRARAPVGRGGVAAALLILVLAVPWCLRGIELSGYPAYPLTWFAPGVEWQLPEDRARNEIDWIRSWARAPDRPPEEVLGQSDWFGPWLRSRLQTADSIVFLVLPISLIAVALALRLAGRRGSPPRSEETSHAGYLLTPFAIAVVAWFASAPDPRFLGAALWVPAAFGIAGAWSAPGIERIAAAARTTAVAVCVLYCASIVERREAWWFTGALPRPIPSVETRIITTRHGVMLHSPVRGQQCWDAPLPCTPYPAPRLALRNVQNPWSGYRLILEGMPE